MEKKKEYITIAGIKVKLNTKKVQLPPDADPFKRASYLISGKMDPENESDHRIIKEAREMEAKGIIVEIPFNW